MKSSENALERWNRLNRHIMKAAKTLSYIAPSHTDALTETTTCINVIRLLASNTTKNTLKARSIVVEHGLPVGDPSSSGSQAIHTYTSYLDDIFIKHGGVDSACPTAGDGSDPPIPKTRRNFLQDIKPSLPSTRSRLRALRTLATSPPTHDPRLLGDIIRKFYGALGQGRSACGIH